jgi:hypothetical protein
MSGTQKMIGTLREERPFLIGTVIRFVAGISLALLLSGPAFAQYGGGGMGTGTSGSGTSGYGAPSYGSGKAIGIGVGAAAAGAGVLYLALHHGSSVTGCVRSGDDGLNLVDDKNKKSYVLLPGGADVRPGERVELKGKKSTEEGKGQTFQARKLVKNLGACGTPSAEAASSFRSASENSGQDYPKR